MSTQNARHPPTNLSVSTPFRSLRLLEVPDDLLKIITSVSESTTKSPLKFKSALPQQHPDRSQTAGQREGTLHLCADGSDKVWAVKQVSTSNSVYLIEPTKQLPSPQSLSAIDDHMSDDPLQNATTGAVTAVAQVSNFLELHPVKVDDRIVEAALIDTIPVHHPLLQEEKDQMDIDLDKHPKFRTGAGPTIPTTWEEAVNNIAAPDDIILKVGQRLGVFEDAHGNCTIPSTRAVLTVWSTIVENAAIEGVKLDRDLSMVRIVNMLIDDNQSSLAETMFKANGLFDQIGLFHDTNNEQSTRGLKPKETCHFVAGLILSSHPHHQMDRDAFVSKWTDLVPASFVKHCDIESLTTQPAYELTSDDDETQIVKWTSPTSTEGPILVSALSLPSSTEPGSAGVSAGTVAETSGKPAVSSAAADKKRKWHEKFGAQRNLKK